MSKKKKENRKIRDKHGSITLQELEDQGLVPKDFHLFDRVEIKEWQAKHPGYAEWERSIREREDTEGPNGHLGV
jgi:hypothetical protein